jgi:hypothetical protein
MGIEHPARKTLVYVNQIVTTVERRCVRFSCEKRRHAGQWRRTSDTSVHNDIGDGRELANEFLRLYASTTDA